MPVFIVTGLGYGDEGKGAVVDHLTREHSARATVFVNGGAQRAHNVVANRQHHTFSQYGSGTFAGAATMHSKYSMVDPHAFFLESDELGELLPKPWENVSVQKGAKIVTPFAVAANRLREKARSQRHGSCGMGIGETVMLDKVGLSLFVEDLADPKLTYEKLHDQQRHYFRSIYDVMRQIKGGDFTEEWWAIKEFSTIQKAMEIYRIFAKVIPVFDEFDFQRDETYIFEGSQGVLLDEFNGFHPHTTWSATTGENARKLLAEMHWGGYREHVEHIGVMRSYMTRHGHGPFVTEDPAMATDLRFSEAHNGHGEWQGAWRRGWTDLRAIRYALGCIGDATVQLAVTHLDRVRGNWKVATEYDREIEIPVFTDRQLWLTQRAETLEQISRAKPLYAEFADMTPEVLLDVIEAQLGLPIRVTGYGPDAYTSREPLLV